LEQYDVKEQATGNFGVFTRVTMVLDKQGDKKKRATWSYKVSS